VIELDLSTASYVEPVTTDEDTLAAVPADYDEFLNTRNGCILFGGGLHIRGACEVPDWHSLRRVWREEDALAVRTGFLGRSIPFEIRARLSA
jgi:hypothetical protein